MSSHECTIAVGASASAFRVADVLPNL